MPQLKASRIFFPTGERFCEGRFCHCLVSPERQTISGLVEDDGTGKATRRGKTKPMKMISRGVVGPMKTAMTKLEIVVRKTMFLESERNSSREGYSTARDSNCLFCQIFQLFNIQITLSCGDFVLYCFPIHNLCELYFCRRFAGAAVIGCCW